MEFHNILMEITDSIGTITINRPQALNALDMTTLSEIEMVVKKLGDDTSCKAIIVTGAGEKAFVAGADIQAMREMTPQQAEEFAEQGHRCMRAIEGCPKVLIAAVNGFALGGGTELAIACDVIYASENAKFGLPEVKLGLYPGFGGTQRLPRLIGVGRARELIFTGRIIDARQALEWGIVNRVVAATELITQTRRLAAEISANGPIAVAKAKRLINSGRDMTLSQALEEERASFSKLFHTHDRIEGLSAFLEKRKAVFKGE